MAKFFDHLNEDLSTFVQEQAIFFVGTAAAEGRVNVSPKGLDTLRVLNPNQVAWINLTGSGNETAAHLLQNSRMTLMFCSFSKRPLILRIYGQAKALHERDEAFGQYVDLFPPMKGTRQIMLLDIESVQTSCGYAVPFMEFKEERSVLTAWVENKGKEGLDAYREEKNQKSIDGFETGLLP